MERSVPDSTSDPAGLGDVLSQLFALRGYGRSQADKQLQEVWRAVAGAQISEQTRVLGLKNGVLQVGVSSSALLSELASFRKGEMLAQLQKEWPQYRLRDLKFQLRGNLRSSRKS